MAALVCSAALLLAAIPAAAQVERIPGTVIGVTDGDTITVRFKDRRTERTRLIGIDTPETRHPRPPAPGPRGPRGVGRTRGRPGAAGLVSDP